jgi:hypothetical protein
VARIIKDKELREYFELIGKSEYKRQYSALYNQAKYHPNSRNSGRRYQNSPQKIKDIKEKYKNGVTEEIMKELFL